MFVLTCWYGAGELVFFSLFLLGRRNGGSGPRTESESREGMQAGLPTNYDEGVGGWAGHTRCHAGVRFPGPFFPPTNGCDGGEQPKTAPSPEEQVHPSVRRVPAVSSICDG